MKARHSHQPVSLPALLWVFGSLAAAALAVFFLHEFQMRRNAGALLRQAEYALDENNFQRASQYLEVYKSYQPTDREALAKFAFVLEKHAATPRQRASAADLFDQILQRSPDRSDIRYRLVWCDLALYRLDHAIAQAKLLLPSWKDKAELHHIIGWCLNNKGEHEEAAASFTRAIAADPGRIDSYFLLADILIERLDRADEAGEVLNNLVEAKPDSYRPFLARARYHRRRGKLEDAAKDIARARELAPQDTAVLLNAIDIAEARGDDKTARETAALGVTAHPESADFPRVLAGIEIRAGNVPAAILAIQEGLKHAPADTELLLGLSDLLIQENRLADARQVLAKFPKSAGSASQYLEARLAYADKRWREAIELLESVGTKRLNADLTTRVNTLLGLCYERLHATDQQLAAFERALAQDPNSAVARAGLGAALLADGRMDEAIAALENVRDRPDAPATTTVLLARALILRNLRLSADLRDWAHVEVVLAQAERAMPQSADVIVLRAEAFAAQAQYGKARTLLKRANADDPNEVLFWCALANLAGQQRQISQGLATLDQAQKRIGDNIELRLARARLLAQEGNAERRKGIAQLAENLDRFEALDRLRLLRELADISEHQGETVQARALWQRAIQLEPRDTRTRLHLIELALALNQPAEAKRQLAEIQKIDAEGMLYSFGKALLAVHEGRLEDANACLIEVKRRRPDWPQLALLQAKIAELAGDTETTIDRYLRALELNSVPPEQVLKLVRLLCERRRFVDADCALRKLEEQAGLPGPLARFGAEIALANNDPFRALARAHLAVNTKTSDYRDLLWLANIVARAGGTDAEKLLRRAVEVGGHVPETWLALLRHLARSDRSAAAAPLIEQLKKEIPQSLLPATLARCQEALGNLDQAAQLFDKAVADNPRDFITLIPAAEYFLRTEMTDKAEARLRELLDKKTRTPGDEMAWARRQLAVLLIEKGTLDTFAEAGALLDANKRILGDTLADERARHYLQGTQPRQCDAAIRALQQSFERQAATSQERLWLVRLLEQAERVQQARALIFDLLAANPDDGQLLSHHIRRLIAQKQLADAQIYLHRLERLEPNSWRTRELDRDLLQAKTSLTSATD